MLFNFYCDASFDGNAKFPKEYVVAGLVADNCHWSLIQGAWQRVNDVFHVARFHAAHLNSKSYEFKGWDDEKKNAYSQRLLRVLSVCSRSLGAVSSGIFADEYRRIISPEGQTKFGTPYMVSFNSCLTGLARLMDKNPADDRISLIIDKDEGWEEAQQTFEWLKNESIFPHRHRFASCTPTSSDDAVCLQAADLVAYEMFKAIKRMRQGKYEKRHPMKALLKHNLVREGYYDGHYLQRIKPWIERTPLTGKYLIHTPTFANYHQEQIPEELDPFMTTFMNEGNV